MRIKRKMGNIRIYRMLPTFNEKQIMQEKGLEPYWKVKKCFKIRRFEHVIIECKQKCKQNYLDT